MPLERLSRNQLEKAKSFLVELTDLAHDLEQQRKNVSDIDIEEILRIQEEIADKSSRFYELIPHKNYQTNPLPPIDNRNIINQKFMVIETLLNFEITSKILLGAHLIKQSLNPLTYSFNALNIRMVNIPELHPEYQMIK